MARRRNGGQKKKANDGQAQARREPPGRVELTGLEVAEYRSIAFELDNIRLRAEFLMRRKAEVLVGRDRLAQKLVDRVPEIDDPAFYNIDTTTGIAERKAQAEIDEIKRARTRPMHV